MLRVLASFSQFVIVSLFRTPIFGFVQSLDYKKGRDHSRSEMCRKICIYIEDCAATEEKTFSCLKLE